MSLFVGCHILTLLLYKTKCITIINRWEQHIFLKVLIYFNGNLPEGKKRL